MPARIVPAALSAAFLSLAVALPLPAAAHGAGAKEPTVGQLAGRERQKKCGVEWRALSAAEKTAQGPRWPQYMSKCVKRLKEQRA